MPASDNHQLLRSQLGAARVVYALLVVGVLLAWLNQQSLALYCQQKYHQRCELPLLGESAAWRLGGNLNQAFVDARERFFDSLTAQRIETPPPMPQPPVVAPVVELPPNIPVVTVRLDVPAARPVAPKPTPKPAPVPVAKPAPVPPPPVAYSPRVTLNANDEVFLVGDSMMQGVAPHLSNTLLKRHGIRSVNLSRQSTGLSYPGFFDWPRTVARTLREHPRIRLMVVFLGPNDPWDMPQGKGKPFLRFKTPAWELSYRQRIDAILDPARERGVQVIWVGPPNMQQPRLSTAMTYLSELYRQQAQQHGQHYVSANVVLGYKADEFSSTVQNGQGGQLRTRADDGIHFTIPGQKLIANQVLALIAFPGPTVTGH
ncbi:SGNH family hydrolase [Pseudomonas sp. 148P]|uniref:SGNH family hydrolase n=1 Tax=Pseudomonas ulcerans TaxID=3115852 RepID=A0ABU7HLA9_9PSED|nr:MULTISPECIES: SGNH family hydrolase [unclassified Pseudomonas]MEE1920794.1 SGNH family hydrolase [Pseudomonas sp. 147P]MEE1932305.1 SGNH family hydrolase [Pseudomonas sp. 148P]